MILDDNLTELLQRLPDNPCAALLLELKNNIQFVYSDIQKIGITENNVLYYSPVGKSNRVIETTPGKLLSKIFLPMWSESGWLKGIDSINSLRALFYPAALSEKVMKLKDIDPNLKADLIESKFIIPQKTKNFIERMINVLGINANQLGRNSELFSEKMLVVLKYQKTKEMSWKEVLKYEKNFPSKGNVPECVFKVVQGDQLIAYYNADSFWRSITSCMSGNGAKSYLQIYRENTDNVALGVILTKDRSPRVMSRCLLWKSDSGEIVMDRRYMGDHSLSNYLDEICVETSFYYRNSNSGSRQLFHQGKMAEKNFTITLQKGKATNYPYMDTFYYFTFFEEKKKAMIKLSMSPSTVLSNESSKTKIVRTTSGGYNDYHFNISELLPWELTDLIISRDPRLNSSNPFGNYNLTFEQRDRICTVRPDMINEAIMNWGHNQNRWLEFLSAYPKYRKSMDFTTLTSSQIKVVYDYCVNNRDFAWIKLCRVKNLTTKDFTIVLQNALQKMGPSEFIDRAGIKATNLITRLNNKSKKNMAKYCGERFPIKDAINMDHITIMEYFIKPLREDNLEELLDIQPFWKKVIPEDHIPIPAKKKEEDFTENPDDDEDEDNEDREDREEYFDTETLKKKEIVVNKPKKVTRKRDGLMDRLLNNLSISPNVAKSIIEEVEMDAERELEF